jgi:hypothetical protein
MEDEEDETKNNVNNIDSQLNDQVQNTVNQILGFMAEKKFEEAVESLKRFYQDFYSKENVEVDEIYVEMMQSVEAKLLNVMKDRAMKAIKVCIFIILLAIIFVNYYFFILLYFLFYCIYFLRMTM